MPLIGLTESHMHLIEFQGKAYLFRFRPNQQLIMSSHPCCCWECRSDLLHATSCPCGLALTASTSERERLDVLYHQSDTALQTMH